MVRFGLASLAVVLLSSCGGDDDCCSSRYDAAVRNDTSTDTGITLVDAPYPDVPPGGVCNPLSQAGCQLGEKCTWIMDALTPQYVGHIGCTPNGTALAGDSCMFGAPGATGYDNCARGFVCGNYRGGTGLCKQICDQQGGTPACGSTSACVVYGGLFSTGSTTPAAAGVCDTRCNPLDDNDFDGSGTALTKSGTACGSAPTTGCYGYPSYGTPPVTAYTCTNDINYTEAQPAGFRHRVACTGANGCADPGPTVNVNSCNQGYSPLLYEQTGSTTIICVAMCAPLNCYAGNCGTSDANRFGAAPHRCNTTDARGTFSQATNGEHCQFLWYREVDDVGNFLPSATSDTVGYCFDHSKYLYDSNNDNVPDAALPACQQLQDGYGSGSNPMMPLTYFGAADLGCVDSTRVMPFHGKPRPPRARALDGIRPLFERTAAP